MSGSSFPANTPVPWTSPPTMAARRWTRYREAGDEAGRLRAATLMARSLINFHLEDEAAAALQSALEEAKPLGEVPALAKAYAELARAEMLAERHAESIAAADQALRMGSIADAETMVEALVTKGTSMTPSQRNVEAEAILRGAIHLADDLGLIQAGLRARNNLSGPLSFRDQAEAGRMIREGYEIANRFGHRPFVYQFLYAALEADLRTGEWDDNIGELDAIEENETPWPFYQIAFSGMRAMRAALRGDLASAEEMLRLADATLPELQSIQSEAFVQLAWAHVLFAAGRWEEAIEHGRQAGANSNFTVDAWWITANAAAAADLRPVLIEASEGSCRWPASPARSAMRSTAAPGPPWLPARDDGKRRMPASRQPSAISPNRASCITPAWRACCGTPCPPAAIPMPPRPAVTQPPSSRSIGRRRSWSGTGRRSFRPLRSRLRRTRPRGRSRRRDRRPPAATLRALSLCSTDMVSAISGGRDIGICAARHIRRPQATQSGPSSR